MLSSDLKKNEAALREAFADCEDVVFRKFTIGEGQRTILMIYIDNMVLGDVIYAAVMTNIMQRANKDCTLQELVEEAVAVGEVKQVEDLQIAKDAILVGDTLLLMDGSSYGAQLSTKKYPSRGVGKVENEMVVQGPKEAFTEQISINIVLIRRRIRDTKLKVRRQRIGKKGKSDVALMYLSDRAKPETVQEVKKELDKLSVSALYDSGYLEQLLEKNWKSVFPMMQITERPDKTAAALLEGRIVLAVDNTPFCILLPVTLNLLFQAAEDYYDRWQLVSALRMLRYLAAWIAITLPALYISMAVFQPQMLPTSLALKIAQSREGIPFSVVSEVVMMELAFELLREAGVRLPSPVSSTMGIVGGIIIGSAAVEAGIVSPMAVIISSLCGICTFLIPNPALVSAIRLMKYPMILLSAMFGLMGLWVGQVVLLLHLSSLKSFGIPYLYPFVSPSVRDFEDLKDSLIRFPLRFLQRSSIFERRKGK